MYSKPLRPEPSRGSRKRGPSRPRARRGDSSSSPRRAFVENTSKFSDAELRDAFASLGDDEIVEAHAAFRSASKLVEQDTARGNRASKRQRHALFDDAVSRAQGAKSGAKPHCARFRRRRDNDENSSRQSNRLSMSGFARRVVRADAAAASSALRREQLHPRWYEDPHADANKECEGDRRIRLINEMLAYMDSFGDYRRSKQQKLMHLAFNSISLQMLYGKDLRRHLLRLLAENGWSELRSECLIFAPRRFGKTRGTALYSAVQLMALESHEVMIYSNNMRASKMMLMEVFMILRKLTAHFNGAVVGMNKLESITVRTPEGNINTLYAYPAKPDNLRGTGAKMKTCMVVGEEFAYMPANLVFAIIGPTLVRIGVIFIGITTVNGSDSFANKIAEKTYPNGTAVVLSINFTLVCDRCRDAGRAEDCRCRAADIPHWHSTKQHRKLKYLVPAEIFAQEVKGTSIEDCLMPAFDRDSCNWLRTNNAIVADAGISAPVVFIAIDPSGGGRNSRYAVVSGMFVRESLIIVGSDSYTTGDPQTNMPRLVQHILRIRRLPGLAHAKIVLSPESNYGNDHSWITMYMATTARVPNVWTLYEGGRQDSGKPVPGFVTTASSKAHMWRLTDMLLRDRHIRWHPSMVCVGNADAVLNEDGDYVLEKPRPEDSAEGMRAIIVEQLENYKRERLPESDIVKGERIRYHGKVGGTPDDHAIAIQALAYTRELWETKACNYKDHRALWTPGNERVRGGYNLQDMIMHRQRQGVLDQQEFMQFRDTPVH